VKKGKQVRTNSPKYKGLKTKNRSANIKPNGLGCSPKVYKEFKKKTRECR